MPVSAPYIASRIIRVLPRTAISTAVGQLCDLRLPPVVSRAVVGAYRRLYAVDMTDVLPLDAPYRSFDEFFTRGLREGCRPVTGDDDELVSPADGQLQVLGKVEAGSRIKVKGRPYDLAKLVGSSEDAGCLVGGQFAVVYLSPRDYHRVHAPVGGVVRQVRALPGDLFPVNSIGECCDDSLLAVNKRVVVRIDTQREMGPVFVVLVGAMVVGRITVEMLAQRDVVCGEHVIEPPYELRRGAELGAFHMGSTAVVLVGPEARPWHRRPGLIRVGESLVRTG